MAGVEFDLASAEDGLAECFLVDDEHRRIGAEILADEPPRRRAGDDGAAAIVGKMIAVRAGSFRSREQVCERRDNVVRDIHVDEVNVDHSRHPNAATAMVTACTASTRITQAVHPPKRQKNPGSTPLTLPP